VHELELRRTKEAQSPHQRLHLASSRQPSATILLVEDNDNLRSLLQRTLEGVGFRVFAAADGAEAFRLCQQHDATIDLVVIDLLPCFRTKLSMICAKERGREYVEEQARKHR